MNKTDKVYFLSCLFSMKFFSDTKKYILHKNITGKIIRIFVPKPRPIKPRYNISMSVYRGSPSCALGGLRCDRVLLSRAHS